MKRVAFLILFGICTNLSFAECGACCKEAGGNPSTIISSVIHKLMEMKGQCYKALAELTGGSTQRVLDCATDEKIGTDAPVFIGCLQGK